jgi:predicted nucleic acid-binding Zn ribbon protein
MPSHPISNVIQDFLTKNGKISLFLEQQAIELWEQAVGEYVAGQTQKITAKQGVLYVSISNAALRFELLNSRSQIINRINEALGGEVVKGVILK